MYVGKHAALILWVAVTVLLAIIVIVAAVIAKLVRNKVKNRPGAMPWPAIVAVSVCLLGALYLFLH